MLTPSREAQYRLQETGEFTIIHYNSAKLFSSFFPGIAGKEGIPMWLFYVNRGQCVCSMGVQDKEHPVMEFLPANRAYQLVTSQGFRTFLKLQDHDSINFYEPFQNHLPERRMKKTQRMIIAPARLTLEEENLTLGLKFTVTYFNIPQANFPGLVRTLHIQNLNRSACTLEGLDGLPLIIPYGVDNESLKFRRRLVEAFVEVSNYDRNVPFFHGKVEPADRPDVVRIKQGNFYLGFESDGQGSSLVSPVVDPVKIFGSQSDYSYPEKFLTGPTEKMLEGQILENRLPCSMGFFQTSIPAGETYKYTSIIGHASSIEDLNSLIPLIASPSYIEEKARINEELIEQLTQKNFICSSTPVLDRYTRQNFLDNVMRGGFPYTFQGSETSFTLHLFSRKHGDLERDYNDYQLTPTNYSQGNGNFRDVNQNRRNDLFFNPDVQDKNVEYFYNLMQLDGFNPLVLKETRFRINDRDKLKSILSAYLDDDKLNLSETFFQETFTPGELVSYLKDNRIALKLDPDDFLGDLIDICDQIHKTSYGEGFWTDHWTYNLDLLENYLAVYPEKLRYLLLEKKTFSFYDNPHRVQPRSEKYVLWEGKPMQLGAVIFDEEKDNIISRRSDNKNRVHTDFGRGQVYYTSLINILVCLIVNKMASLDPEGVGVEMEADKPDWYDALNGLPGLLGSSISETLEIKRHIMFLQKVLAEIASDREEWPIGTELKQLLEAVHTLLSSKLSPFEFWDKAASARESFREKTRLGISGIELSINISEIRNFFKACLKKLEDGIIKAWDHESNVISTYFINEVTDYEEIKISAQKGKTRTKCNQKGLVCFRPLKFRQTALPLFLEGPVHYLRCLPPGTKAASLINNIRYSGLYDQKLKMYKVNASLADQPLEIGRARTFSPGWFENESIWLHMEYKYMLEILRNQFYSEFYRDFTRVLVPFFQPEIYGRSILENSSFIVSSANPDPSLHGNGFVARLSGATAEFIHLLVMMTTGPRPFTLNSAGDLQLEFNPALAGWLFTAEKQKRRLFIDDKWQEIEFPPNTFSFMFLGSILVTYHNPDGADTFGPQGVSPSAWKVWDFNGNSRIYSNDAIKGDIARSIRDRKISRIDIELRRNPAAKF
ncbi:MAG: hypothetical protein JW784_05040 [Candidatus Cloacimonetes bacterium]|nr:hypothetical protein [Candidatus Cloacimonadota bacterium]